jgi:hypothetical protein
MAFREDLIRQFRDQQQKYTYYLVALCVASIAFSVNKTTGLPLSASQIPLGLALLSWSASIFCGLTFITRITSSLYTNVQLANEHDKLQSAAEKRYFETLVETKMKPLSDKTTKLYAWQTKTFYMGIVFFVAWHVYEMYLLTLD